jgi:SpoVK/Ycf46/Vps4 family AAA+-type ATPase
MTTHYIAVTETSGEHFAAQCALNVYNSVERNSREGRAINRWMMRNIDPRRLPDNTYYGDEAYENANPNNVDSDHYLATPESWHDISFALHKAAACMAPTGDVEAAWITALTAKLQLDRLTSKILALVIYYYSHQDVQSLVDCISYYRRINTDSFPRNLGLIAKLLDASPGEVLRCLLPSAPLVENGLLLLDYQCHLQISKQLRQLVELEIQPGGDLATQILGTAEPAKLSWQSFVHVGPEAEIAASILRAAMARDERGINILLYGPPGTGKTSFAATLAANVNSKLCLAAETDQYGGEPSRADRLSGLRLAQCLAKQANALLLFDEAEDLLVEGDNRYDGSTRTSRAFTHRLLEHNRVPVIWTANDIGVLGPAVLRRMTMCLEMRIPDISTRTTLWHDMAQMENIPLARNEAARLARLVSAAPAVAATALRGARLAGGDAETAHIIVEGIARAVQGGHLPAPEQPQDEHYDLSLINADCDLSALTERLCQPDAPRYISFLLSGPPGTGKSAWVRHLAGKMGLPVLHKRASDLLGCFVGETEKHIAAAFAEARASRAFLIFDEADSLLFDRAHATRSWEVTQINEMLTWMSEHTYPFACTTNLVERLDEASLRRFLIKIRLGWLRPAQAGAAFQTFFGLAAPAALDSLTNLTPADFALVRRRARVSGVSSDAQALVRLLAAECRGRAAGANQIGFSPNRTNHHCNVPDGLAA